jgi:hypothetical protein
VAPRYVTLKDLREGLLVEYLGDAAEVRGVISEELTSRAMALFPGHPGRIWCPMWQHVQVSWVGLEQEPASYAVGFSTSRAADGRFPGLGHLGEAEFVQRERALADILASGRNLSGWVPPWLASHRTPRNAP